MGKGLSDEQIQFYKENGYVHIKNLLTPAELTEISNEYDNLFRRKNQGIMENSWVGGVADDLRITDSPYSVRKSRYYCLLLFINASPYYLVPVLRSTRDTTIIFISYSFILT